MDMLGLLAFFVVGAVGGFFGATVGGGGMLVIPYLVFAGLPIEVAIATARFGDIGFAGMSAWKFSQAKQIMWKYVRPLAILSLAGALIGTVILLSTGKEDLKTVAAILLLVLLPFVLLNKKTGIVRREVSNASKALGSVVYFVLEAVTGFFAAGTGPLKYYTLMLGFGLTLTEAVATQMIPYLLLATMTTGVFAVLGLIDYAAGVVLILGSIAGGYLGARFAMAMSAVWLKRLFAGMVLIAVIKLLFF